jgi:hypothetical protein
MFHGAALEIPDAPVGNGSRALPNRRRLPRVRDAAFSAIAVRNTTIRSDSPSLRSQINASCVRHPE